MKEIKSTLDGVEFHDNRMKGNSTRQIDAAIQYLFNGYKVEIKDHYERGAHRKSNEGLFNSVLRRLQMEHRLDILIKEKKIEIDRNKFTLELL